MSQAEGEPTILEGQVWPGQEVPYTRLHYVYRFHLPFFKPRLLLLPLRGLVLTLALVVWLSRHHYHHPVVVSYRKPEEKALTIVPTISSNIRGRNKKKNTTEEEEKESPLSSSSSSTAKKCPNELNQKYLTYFLIFLFLYLAKPRGTPFRWTSSPMLKGTNLIQ